MRFKRGVKGEINSKLRAPAARCASVGGAALLLAAGFALSGCAGPDKKSEKKPHEDGDVPAGSPDKKGKPAEAPGHPPDEQPAGGGGGGGKDKLLEDLHGELTLRDKERRALAEHYFKVGKQFYDQFEYGEAAKNFAKAKEADPNDKKVQQFYVMASLLAGDRQAEFQGIAERLKDERNVAIEQQVIELRKIYAEATKLLEDQREYDRAIVRYEQVLEKIRWFPYPVSDAGIEKGAREGIIKAKQKKRDQEVADRVNREKIALETAVAEEQAAQERKKALVAKLISDGVEQLNLEKYEKAEAIFRDVLEARDPSNEQAHKFLEIAEEGRHLKEARTNYNEDTYEKDRDRQYMDEHAVTYVPSGRVVEFPNRDYWFEKVSRRRAGIARSQSDEPQWVQDYKKKLATQKLTFNFSGTPFSEVVQFLQDFTGLNIVVSKNIDQEQLKLDLKLRDVIAENALKIILDQTGLAISFKNEALNITPKDESKGEYYLDIYDVQDILAAIPDFPGPRIQVRSAKGGGGGGGRTRGGGNFTFDDDEQEETGAVIEPEKLEALIKNSTGADEVWGDPASYELHRGQIIVNQTKVVHDRLQTVLKNLRTNVGLFVQIEARFILIHNDFLEDIGIDYRGLGLSDQGANPPLPIWGTPVTLDPNIPQNNALRRGGDDIGFGQRVNAGNKARRLGPSFAGVPFFGSSYLGGRLQNILDGGDAYFSGDRLNSAAISGSQLPKGLAFQSTILDPFQINAIVRAEKERLKEKIVTAPVVVAANRQRVHISVVTQRAYIADFELSSGGTGFSVAEVASPIIQTIQEGVVLDVRPTISADRKYVTLDLRPTLADLQALKQIPVNLGTVSAAAVNVNIEVPELKLQEAYTSVTVPDGGTALVGGFRQFNERQQRSGVPFVDNVPFLNVLFKREAELRETESLVVLVTARIVILRDEEKKRFNAPKSD